MNSVRIQTGATERIEVLCLDATRAPVTGKTDIYIQIRRVSDGFFYDFFDDTFKSTGWTDRLQQLTETDATNDAGNYHYDWDTSDIFNETDDDTYQVRALQTPGTDVANLPQTGEIKLGQYVDDIDVAISSRSSHSAADIWTVTTRTLTSFGSLASDVWANPTRTLTSFGTLVADMATAVWAHATRTLTSFGSLASDIWANPTRTLTSLGTLVSDIATAVWGAATRTLTSFGTLVADITASVAANLAGTHGGGSWLTADLTPVAREAQATVNTNAIITEVNENESKIDAIIVNQGTASLEIQKILSLLGWNMRIYDTVLDGNGNLLSQKMRGYPTKADAIADTNHFIEIHFTGTAAGFQSTLMGVQEP